MCLSLKSRVQTTFSHVESNYGVNTTVCTSVCQASGGCGSPAHLPQPGAIEQIPTRGRPCHSFVGFIAWPCWLMQPGLAVDTAMWRPSCVLGGPACRDGALWLEEVWLGWMSTVHRAEGTRGLTATALSQSPLTPPHTPQKSPSCAHTGIVTHWPCLSSCGASRPFNCAPLFLRREDGCVSEAEWRGKRSRSSGWL